MIKKKLLKKQRPKLDRKPNEIKYWGVKLKKKINQENNKNITIKQKMN
jgi:hypothetical protein